MSFFKFNFDSKEDRALFEDWWNDYGYYECISHFESKGFNIMFESNENGEKVTIVGEYEDEY